MSEQKTAEALIREALEIGLEYARENAVRTAHHYGPYLKEGLGRHVVAAEREVKVIEDALALSPKPDRPMLSDAQIDAIAFATEHRPEWSDDPEIWRRDFARACIRADREGQS